MLSFFLVWFLFVCGCEVGQLCLSPVGCFDFDENLFQSRYLSSSVNFGLIKSTPGDVVAFLAVLGKVEAGDFSFFGHSQSNNRFDD